ncbi:carboxy terminal-processing peptidase [Salibacter halophilus]|uniref:PDZ domain-containing protein n=1 Tax=Salibacter halophilus TaxID=1803916 RepID=A0A6N6MAB6_9FLAO|nr:carboxy terminal-processing peptidase [Salibacter halophilus]KAB1065206.1 hypothetical protein F3059_04425 [Salibacter halophilus]
MIKTIQRHHYNAREIDRSFSSFVFDQTLDLLDPNHIFLTEGDVQSLEKYRYDLKSSIDNNNCEFIDELSDVLSKRLVSAEIFYSDHLTGKFNYREEDKFVFYQRVNGSDREKHLKNWIKYEVLNSAHKLIEDGADVDSVLSAVQKQIIQRDICQIQSVTKSSKGVDEYVGVKFLKALAEGFDPHSTYFTPYQENEMRKSLSQKSESYGFQLSENEKGEIEIYALIPGSPAWKSNILNEGDVLLSITEPDGKKTTVNCNTYNEVVQILTFLTADQVTGFEFRKKTGEIVLVELNKAEISNIDNSIKSFIIDSLNSVGYINIPSFYVDSYSTTRGGCADDLARELIKLKRQGIEGLIVDVRNNGGGDMREAINLAGIFVNFGALSILDANGFEPSTLKDPNRGSIYRGPLVIMTNKASASASELLAAAMQDYNRGLVVGSPTYGKSTSQIIVPLDAYKSDFENIDAESKSDLGYVKLTNGKFYRVDGESHQLEGVLPDIYLPSPFDSLSYGERYSPTALANTSIDKKTYYRPRQKLPIEELKEQSRQRVTKDENFKSLKELNNAFQEWYNRDYVPVSLSSYSNYIKQNPSSEYDKASTAHNNRLLVKNPDYLSGLSSKDNDGVINKNTIDRIKSDPYIKETYFIINDLINNN